MYYINKKPTENGNYGNPHSTADGYALPDALLGSYLDTRGFALLQVDGDTVTSVTVNQTALDTYLAEHPSVEPAPETPSETAQLRAAAAAFCSTATLITDTQALAMPSLFPTWEEARAAGAALPEGRILSDGGRLYRVVQPVTPQAHQAPHDVGMLAVYRPIDKAHAGTLADPIPWVYGIDCNTGLYYAYDGKVYLCKGDMKPCVWAPDTTGMWQWEKV